MKYLPIEDFFLTEYNKGKQVIRIVLRLPSYDGINTKETTILEIEPYNIHWASGTLIQLSKMVIEVPDNKRRMKK